MTLFWFIPRPGKKRQNTHELRADEPKTQRKRRICRKSCDISQSATEVRAAADRRSRSHARLCHALSETSGAAVELTPLGLTLHHLQCQIIGSHINWLTRTERFTCWTPVEQPCMNNYPGTQTKKQKKLLLLKSKEFLKQTIPRKLSNAQGHSPNHTSEDYNCDAFYH